MKKYLPFVLLGFLFFAPKAHAATSLVQTTSTFLGNYLTPTSTISFGSNTTAGDFIVVALQTTASATVAAPTDTQGNTYYALPWVIAPTYQDSLGLYYAMNIVGGPDTVHFNSSLKGSVAVAEFSGVATTNALDSYASLSVTSYSVTWQTPTTTASAASDLAIGVFSAATVAASPTAGSPFSVFTTSTSPLLGTYATTSPSVVSSTVTITTANTEPVRYIATFKAGSTPPPSNPILMFFRWIFD